MKAQLVCDIIEFADGEHPDLWVAKQGEIGELEQGEFWEAYLRLNDGRRIGVKLDEIKRL